MKDWFPQLDALLRVRCMHPDENDASASALGKIRPKILLGLLVLLGGTYGFFMGWYSVRERGLDGIYQMLSSTLKIPLLFVLTLGVTFPSLYVFGALTGSGMGFRRAMRAVGEWIVVMLAVAASLGPILGFFTLSTESYAFMILLNAVFLGLAGFSGCATLARRIAADRVNAMPGFGDGGFFVLTVWIALFGLVGLQMAWVLRPFIGAPGSPFVLFRDIGGNAYGALFGAVSHLLGGA